MFQWFLFTNFRNYFDNYIVNNHFGKENVFKIENSIKYIFKYIVHDNNVTIQLFDNILNITVVCQYQLHAEENCLTICFNLCLHNL